MKQKSLLQNLVFGLLVLLVQLVPASAQDGETTGENGDTEPKVEVVAPPENTQADDADATIRAYLETIFANVDDLKEVQVAVRNGVVRLAGEASGDVARTKAEEVAKGIDGVVYVENDIVQTTDVGERLSPSLRRVNSFFDKLRAQLPLIAIAILVLVLAWLLSRLAGWMFLKLRIPRKNPMLRHLVSNLVRVAVMMVGLYLALEVVGATTVVGAVLGAAGVAGLALSFAFRDIIENYLASVILSVRQPFGIKDRVEINGRVGRVVRLTSSETLLMTDDGNHCRLPNSEVFKGTITNYTRNPRRRLHFTVGIGTGENLVEANHFALDVLRNLEGVLDDPAPSAVVAELGDSSVTVGFYAWVDQSKHDFAKVRSYAILRVKEGFDESGIEMPNPTYELNLHDRKAAADPEPKQWPPEKKKPKTRSDIAVESEEEKVGEEEEIDLSPETHIDSQIDAEQAAAPEENLLSEDNSQ